MRIIGAVMKCQPVARALFEQKLPVMRIGFAVYRETVEFAGAARHLFKHHVQSLGRRRLRRRLAEEGIVPNGFRRWRPLWSAVLIGVFYDNAQSAFAHRILG